MRRSFQIPLSRSAFGLIIRGFGVGSLARSVGQRTCGRLSVVRRGAAEVDCAFAAAAAMIGGDDNITQNVDSKERERDKDEGEEAECKPGRATEGPIAVQRNGIILMIV